MILIDTEETDEFVDINHYKDFNLFIENQLALVGIDHQLGCLIYLLKTATVVVDDSGIESRHLFLSRNSSRHSFPLGDVDSSSTYSLPGICLVIHSHRGTGFLNPFPSGNSIK